MKIQKADMYEIIKKYVIGQNVLDVGCVGSVKEKTYIEKKKIWLHGFISRYAKTCVGVDIAEKEVKKLKDAGYNCVAGNAETIDVGRKFDVIIASNLIEHLYNPGLFLENVKRHLKTGGVVLISTPNPFFLMKFIEIVAKDDQGCGEHTMWFDPKTLSNLMSAYGFGIKEIYWTTSYHVRPWSHFVRLARAIRGYFCSGFTIVGVVREKE